MRLKSKIILPFAQYIRRDVLKWSRNAVSDQSNILAALVSRAKDTEFGRDHDFKSIQNHEDYTKRVPVRDYEGLKPYIEKVVAGQEGVLWPGKPKYIAKTSGTTSGIKYIPLTQASIPNHIVSTRNALLNYIAIHKTPIFDGKVIFLSGSPELDDSYAVPTGRLSGIVNHEVPAWVRVNQLPSYEVNCIDDWESKLDAIIEQTLKQDMRLISGIPPWVQMYFERILEKTGKKNIMEVFPNFSLFIYGGVNYEPYRASIEKLIGKRVDSLEVFPASEGFIAFQDDFTQQGLLLNTRADIFFEFIPLENVFEENPPRLCLDSVKLGKDYALILSNNAGLWAYNIGDVVRFVSLDPYRVIVTGRIKHFISAFGEHVIGKEVEQALGAVAEKFNSNVVEFTVAPQVNPGNGQLPYHEWFIEFETVPEDMEEFRIALDQAMVGQNIYYKDLISGKILQSLKVVPMQKDAFRNYMKDLGKLGGQNKLPRLSNDRKVADALIPYIL